MMDGRVLHVLREARVDLLLAQGIFVGKVLLEE